MDPGSALPAAGRGARLAAAVAAVAAAAALAGAAPPRAARGQPPRPVRTARRATPTLVRAAVGARPPAAAVAPAPPGDDPTPPRPHARAHTGRLTTIQQRLGRQVSASVDAGAATVTYDDFLNSHVGSVSPVVRVENARALVVARGAYSRFESGSQSVQAALSGSVVSPELFGVRGEFFGTGAITRFRGDLAATNLFGGGRLHVAAPTAGAWAGAGLGLVSQRSRLPDDAGQLDAGAWVREGPLTYTIALQPTRVAGQRYADATLGVRWQGAAGELAVAGGYRARAPEALPGVRTWLDGWATLWVGPRVAVVAGGGVFPFDPLQGLPGGRYLSAAVRLASRRPAVNDPALRAELLLPYEVRRLRAARADLFVVEERDAGARVLRVVVAGGATRVELMGDFTDWTPVALARTDAPGAGAARGDVWAAELIIAPGVHRVNLRIDGGAWRPPPGLSTVRDDFGGEVGLLVVR